MSQTSGKLGLAKGLRQFEEENPSPLSRKKASLELRIVEKRTEKAMAPDSSTLAWKIPWMEEPGGLQSMGSLRVGHN